MKVEPGTLALAVAASSNDKIGESATTYAAQSSCPASCVFKDGGGCYAEEGMLGMTITGPLNNAAATALFEDSAVTAAKIAWAEAEAIDGLDVNEGYPLRLHTVGDCSTIEAAQIVAAAALRYIQRGGGPVFTYTHAWREVPRWAWHGVDVLASCETPEDVAAAHARDYATALVVEEFPIAKRYRTATGFVPGGVSVLPCPAQTKEDVTCSSCRLCMNTDRLLEQRLTIGFAIHGRQLTIRRAKLALREPENPDRKLSSRVLIPRFVGSFTREHGREPTDAEVARGLDLSPSSVWEMRKSLRTGKPTVKHPRRARSRS